MSGQAKEKSSCTKNLVRKISPGSGRYTLEPGVYEIEYASGGGGGGGSYGVSEWVFRGIGIKKCYWHGGGNGGAGDKSTSQIYHILRPTVLEYNVGAGGTKGNGKENGGDGGDTTWTLLGSTYTTHGGKGGGGAGKDNGGADREASGNGEGGKGGAAGPGENCKSNDGKFGGDGWITIYRYSC